MQSVFVLVTKLIASKNYFCKEVFCNNFGRVGKLEFRGKVRREDFENFISNFVSFPEPFKKALLQSPWDMIRGRNLREMIQIRARKSEL